jgi:hypothetical protein
MIGDLLSQVVFGDECHNIFLNIQTYLFIQKSKLIKEHESSQNIIFIEGPKY